LRRFELWRWLHWGKEFNTEIAEDTEDTEKKRENLSNEAESFLV
jgi:hypothetical protein